jgi:hypothetical protein
LSAHEGPHKGVHHVALFPWLLELLSLSARRVRKKVERSKKEVYILVENRSTFLQTLELYASPFGGEI